MSNARIWVLGAADPEMEEIETLLRECGERVVYAVDERGERVSPATAYRAVGTRERDTTHWCGGNDGAAWGFDADEGMPSVYLVECAVDAGTSGYGPHARIDHHRPGDPGYGRPPSEFLPASSLGQVIAELARLDVLPSTWDTEPYDGHYCDEWAVHGVELGVVGPRARWVHVGERDQPVVVMPTDLVLTAAADHCLGAAYRGECPGVDPDALMRWRAESRARHQGRGIGDVLADVERAQSALREASEVTLLAIGDMPHTSDHDWSRSVCDGCAREPITVADMRREGKPIPELPEAATRLGIGYISGPLASPDGRRKYTCSGTPEQVRAFLEVWAPREGLTDLYGDPARGFAGGYGTAELPA